MYGGRDYICIISILMISINSANIIMAVNKMPSFISDGRIQI